MDAARPSTRKDSSLPTLPRNPARCRPDLEPTANASSLARFGAKRRFKHVGSRVQGHERDPKPHQVQKRESLATPKTHANPELIIHEPSHIARSAWPPPPPVSAPFARPLVIGRVESGRSSAVPPRTTGAATRLTIPLDPLQRTPRAATMLPAHTARPGTNHGGQQPFAHR
jgi:hypothetical protein